ncbi:hypothetical protein DSM03_1011081 [Leeuwenhoekiella aestuarii]|uniref:HipA-like kinase domain-containing protein n=1 Tax=Leeuwenhoekiella aestuarii TaxID=2249426 RepID=A0A4Q0P2G7_9FLAO|nr:HipA family kinase [Leeuwenhoekiella aestuarii]RXG18399.1 hypothetical protein DSM04_101592 [Leeuwenhoekiella aestuarii]RXG19704.1 hypothetical protein DSM03_1011081 [Leeuwenhoekiella aestuarii]
MINVINTELLLEEIQTDGHAPLKFLCDNNKIYYCKYLNAFNKHELNLLAYEMISSHLLKRLSIPTPEVALVKVARGTLNKYKIRYNRRLKEGNICFGSQEITPAQELQAIQTFSKYDFNRISNPADLVRIAIFDLWTNNVDRGRNFEGGINYNLLIASELNKQKIYAFDNAFTFGGVDEIGIFNANSIPNAYNKLVLSPFYRDIIQHIAIKDFNKIVDNFIPLLFISYSELINEVIDQLPSEWLLTKNLNDRIDKFLSNKERIEAIKTIILRSKS